MKEENTGLGCLDGKEKGNVRTRVYVQLGMKHTRQDQGMIGFVGPRSRHGSSHFAKDRSSSTTKVNWGSFLSYLLVSFYPTWPIPKVTFMGLAIEAKRAYKLLLKWQGVWKHPHDIDQKAIHNYESCSALPHPISTQNKKINIYKLGSRRAKNRCNKLCCFWRLILCLLVGKKQPHFYCEGLQLIRQSEDSSFFPVFLLKWIRHFVFHKIIMQLHSTFLHPSVL